MDWLYLSAVDDLSRLSDTLEVEAGSKVADVSKQDCKACHSVAIPLIDGVRLRHNAPSGRRRNVMWFVTLGVALGCCRWAFQAQVVCGTVRVDDAPGVV